MFDNEKGNFFNPTDSPYFMDDFLLILVCRILPQAARATYFRVSYGSLTGHTVQGCLYPNMGQRANETAPVFCLATAFDTSL